MWSDVELLVIKLTKRLFLSMPRPVKHEILEVAKEFLFEVIFVTSYGHMSNYSFDECWIYVEEEKDTVVTQDIRVASTLLPKENSVLSPKGILYKEKDMDTALDLRFISARPAVMDIMEKVQNHIPRGIG
ncbi:DUF188 domain-containing protein [Bacillus sp. 1NLA3E]|uniref:DUF188 domain-containing protein n=1 Tax=Bacillus sp. 1NLA3E TaxID=666686 RepID=UPI000247EEF8|nr:DUF188 domain-containing protein [Bacillus sp. 1NLA3E]AGK54953.1 UPF0178 protein [Bacillus sp. 1NLA3E]